MKTRFAAMAVLAVLIVLVSSATITTSSESDALDPPYIAYYKNQLSTDQMLIYDELKLHSTNPVEEYGNYYYEYTGISGSKSDVLKAWSALKLDDPYAFVTWTKDDLAYPEITLSSGNLKIKTDEMFKDAVGMLSDVQAAINGFTLSGNDIPDRMKSINSVLKVNGFKYDATGANGVYGVIGGEEHKLSSAGFSAVFKALTMRNVDSLVVNCMQVYGTLANGSKNVAYAWNVVILGDGEVYAVDSAYDNEHGSEDALCVGRYTTVGGELFGKTHLAFEFNTSTGLVYEFHSELICNDGYDWPSSTSVLDILTEYAPWILVGVICVVLAIYLFVTARKGGFA